MPGTVTEAQLQKILERLQDNAGKLSRATQDIAQALVDTSDKFRKARIEDAVKKTAEEMNSSLAGTTKGLQKFVTLLNQQVRSYENVIETLDDFDSANEESVESFKQASKEYLKAAKDAGELEKIFGQNLSQHADLFGRVLSDSADAASGDFEKLAIVFQLYAPQLQTSIGGATKALTKLEKEVKSVSMKESIYDAIEKQGGIGKALSEGIRGPNGMIKFTNFLKAFFAEQLLGGVKKFVGQLIEQARMYDKTGVQPLYKASARLLLQTTDLQTIMNDNKDTIYAVNGGAQAFTDTLIDLQMQTMELAGQDPILSGKLGAAAQAFSTQLASNTLGFEELKKRSKDYLSGVKTLTRATGMSAEEVVTWNESIVQDSEIREGLAKATEKERASVLQNINARVAELKAIGFTTEKAKQLSVDFEKLRRAATPVQRIRGAAQLGVLAAQVGMSPEDTRRLMILTRKKRNDAEELEYKKLQMDLGKRYQTKFNQLDEASNPFADNMQDLSNRVAEALPGFKAVFDATRVEGTISEGKKRVGDAGKQGLQVADGVKDAVIQAGRIAGWVEKIFNFLSGNGLVGIVVGLLGTMLMGGFGGVLSGLGTIIAMMKGGLGGAGGAGAAGALGKAGIVAATGLAAYELTTLAMEKSGLRDALSNKIADWQSSGEPDPTASITTEQINESRAKRGLPPLGKMGAATSAVEPATPTSPTVTSATPITAPSAIVPAPATAAPTVTATADPMQMLVNLMQQTKMVQEQISKNIAELLKAYMDTEAAKALLATGAGTKAALEAARRLP